MILPLGEVAALATAFCWTASALCWTAAGRRVGSLSVNIIRLLLATPMFLLYNGVVLGQVLPLSASRHAWFWMSLSGVVGFFLCDLFFFRSFLMIGPRLALLVFSLAPPLSALFGWLLIGERLTCWNLIGMAVTMGGVLWVVLETPSRSDNQEEAPRRMTLKGGLFALIATAAQALATVFCRIGMRDMASPVAATEIRLLSGVVCFVVLILAMGRQKQVMCALRDARAMAIMTLGAFVGPFLGVSLLMLALQHIPSGLAQTFVSLSPVIVIPASALLFRERIGVRAIIGALVAVCGVALLFV